MTYSMDPIMKNINNHQLMKKMIKRMQTVTPFIDNYHGLNVLMKITYKISSIYHDGAYNLP